MIVSMVVIYRCLSFDLDEGSGAARHCSLDEDLVCVDTYDLQVLEGNTIASHASSHALVLEDALEAGGSDGTWSTLAMLLTVSAGTSLETMASYNSLESL